MPTLTDAEAALAKASAAHDKARLASEKAAADAAALRASVRAGKGAKVTAGDLAAADATAEHAALIQHGAGVDLPALSAAVQAARADEAADEVVTQLPQLGRDLAVALDAVAEALAPVIAASQAYDHFVEIATHRLHTVARPPEDHRPHAVSAPAVRPGVGRLRRHSTVVRTQRLLPPSTPRRLRARLGFPSPATAIRGLTT